MSCKNSIFAEIKNILKGSTKDTLYITITYYCSDILLNPPTSSLYIGGQKYKGANQVTWKPWLVNPRYFLNTYKYIETEEWSYDTSA